MTAAVRIGQNPGSQGPVRGGNSGAYARRSITGYCVGGALGVLVDATMGGSVQRVRPRTPQRARRSLRRSNGLSSP